MAAHDDGVPPSVDVGGGADSHVVEVDPTAGGGSGASPPVDVVDPTGGGSSDFDTIDLNPASGGSSDFDTIDLNPASGGGSPPGGGGGGGGGVPPPGGGGGGLIGGTDWRGICRRLLPYGPDERPPRSPRVPIWVRFRDFIRNRFAFMRDPFVIWVCAAVLILIILTAVCGGAIILIMFHIKHLN